MALIFRVVYPDGEQVWAVGYPHAPLTVRDVPRGPAACYLDEIEVDFTTYNTTDASAILPVRRVIGGPRRPSIHVRVPLDEPALEQWMTAREAEGWCVNNSPDDPTLVFVIADERDIHRRLDPADLERTGGTILRRPSHPTNPRQPSTTTK